MKILSEFSSNSVDRPVLWYEGLRVLPQHFQAEQRANQYAIDHLIKYYLGNRWGILSCVFKKQSLLNNQIELVDFKGRFQSGESVEYSASEGQSLSLKINPDHSGNMIYLCMPKFNHHQENLDVQKALEDIDSEKGCRSWRITQKILKDKTSVAHEGQPLPENETAPIYFWRHRLVLKTFQNQPNKEIIEQYNILPIAKIKKVQENGEIILDHHYIPPLISIHSHQKLMDLSEELLSLTHKQLQNIQYLDKSSDALKIIYLKEFYLSLKLLKHKPEASPLDLYQIFILLIDRMNVLSKTSGSYVHPDFNLTDLSKIFSSLFEKISRAINALSFQENQHWVAYQKDELSQSTRFYFEIDDLNTSDLNQFILVAHSTIDPDKLYQQLPTHLKLAPEKHLAHIVSRHIPGVKITPLSSVPQGIVYQSNQAYFRIESDSRLWQEALKQGVLAIEVGRIFPELSLSIWGLKEDLEGKAHARLESI